MRFPFLCYSKTEATIFKNVHTVTEYLRIIELYLKIIFMSRHIYNCRKELSKIV
jgi:hypothetical protein